MSDRLSRSLRRRELLKVVGAGVALAGVTPLLQACGAPAPTPTPAPAAPKPADKPAAAAPTPTPAPKAAEPKPAAATPTPAAAAQPAKTARKTAELWTGFDPKTHGRVGEAYDKIIKDFNAANAEYEVKHVIVPWGEIVTKVTASVAAGNPPDAFRHWFHSMGSLAQAGALAPLDSYVTRDAGEWKPDDIWAAAREQAKYRGKTYAAPISCIVQLMWMNLDRAAEKGLKTDPLPTTLEGWEELGHQMTEVGGDKKITKLGFCPFVVAPVLQWPAVFGAWNVYDGETDRFNAATPEMIRTYEWIKSYADRYGGQNLIAWRDSYSSGTFGRFTADGPVYTGLLGMAALSTWWFADIAHYAPKMKYAFDATPPPKDVANYRASNLNTNMYSIPAKAKNPDGGWAWLKYLTGPKAMAEKAAADQVTPARESIATTPDFKKAQPVLARAAEKVLPKAWPTPGFRSFSVMSRELTTAVDEVVLGRKAVKQALEAVTNVVKADMEKKPA